MIANIFVAFFLKGGPIMWPILVCAVVAIAVVGERAFWWWHESHLRDHDTLMKIMDALHRGDLKGAASLGKGSQDPVIQMVDHGLNDHETSLQVAMQAAAGAVLRRAGRFLPVMDTLVTLAPLLGLLGTVTGIMRSFTSIGSAELAVGKVTGGIGEALIATACGLGIAILSLIPLNYFGGKVAELQYELETAASNVEVLLSRLKRRSRQTNNGIPD
ncbi:MAG TPA: MotA/TolQ/ExbB proton channel family protein [Verrucomicrobiae bacterium]|nr:MotA/TolQ/ExbB proton channel family protein [Verrucomicrobiae bacterium]